MKLREIYELLHVFFETLSKLKIFSFTAFLFFSNSSSARGSCIAITCRLDPFPPITSQHSLASCKLKLIVKIYGWVFESLNIVAPVYFGTHFLEMVLELDFGEWKSHLWE